jgi:AcrR family transcriptional regulator
MPEPQVRRRRQRSDARQSIAAVTDAAVQVLAGRPDASMEEVARAAGVSRQTVYAHFPSRDALIDAVIERAAAEFTSLLDGLELGKAPPAQALIRLMEVGWRIADRYPFLWLQPAVDPGKDADRHAPVLDALLDIVRRGQASGDFDASVPEHWLLSAVLAVGRATEDEVRANRMTIEEATRAMHQSVLRLLGARVLLMPGHDRRRHSTGCGTSVLSGLELPAGTTAWHANCPAGLSPQHPDGAPGAGRAGQAPVSGQ